MQNTKTEIAIASSRTQQQIAAAVVVIPFLGFAAAIALVFKQGINFLEIGMLLVMYLLGMLGITVGFHRYFAHKSFETGPRMRTALGVLGSLASQGPLLFWVATHRRHHACSDGPGDPHSPNLLEGDGFWTAVKGLWYGHIGWMFSNELTDWGHYSRDLLRDRSLFKIHRLYFPIVLAGLIVPTVAGLLITRTWMGALQGFLWGGLVRIFLVNHALWCVGSICHFFGPQPFDNHDHSTNNWWVALFTFGEGNQNNHHAFPSSYKHGLEWWQPDFTATIIRVLVAMGLVWDVKRPLPEERMVARRITHA